MANIAKNIFKSFSYYRSDITRTVGHFWGHPVGAGMG